MPKTWKKKTLFGKSLEDIIDDLKFWSGPIAVIAFIFLMKWLFE